MAWIRSLVYRTSLLRRKERDMSSAQLEGGIESSRAFGSPKSISLRACRASQKAMESLLDFLQSNWRYIVFLSPVLSIFSYASLRHYTEVGRKRRCVQNERVLILGGSSGIGLEIARQYLTSGGAAEVFLVGRNSGKLNEALDHCRSILEDDGGGGDKRKGRVVGLTADLSSVEDMIRVKDKVVEEFGGINTLIVSAGVSATRPLLDIASSSSPSEGIHRAVSVANSALQSNYIGPLVAAVTFIPLLQQASPNTPAILLISSLASVIPAPTRTLYGSTKAASLMLYQSLAIEHPGIRWSFVLPSTVRGGFRGSAIDVDVQSDSKANNAKDTSAKFTASTMEGLKVEDVARRCIVAIERGEKLVFFPSFMPRIGHFLYWLWPGFVERKAMKKYGFISQTSSS
ncbi:hypothetical protein PQX77_018844 [Marasmius sp. AFHP31]|nr:hypothetical protein PQX77_018844 [Marasmius sp. AFHP31]